MRYREQDHEKVKAFMEEMKDVPKDKIVYTDETGIDTYLYREYGYAPKGEKVIYFIKGRKYQRASLVAGLPNGNPIAPMEYGGTTKSGFFER